MRAALPIVSYTSWVTSDQSQYPPQVDCFDIVLDRPAVEVGWPERTPTTISPTAGSFGKLEGVVKLHLNSVLNTVKAISFRFVAGAVAKLDGPQESYMLRGPQRLFDRTVSLWESTDSQPYLQAQEHAFRFALKVPSHMPASIQFEGGQIQYMLVASVHWKNITLCGLSLPTFLQWRPVVINCEVPVRHVPSVAAVVRRIQSRDQKQVRVAIPDSESSVPKTIWTPAQDVEVSVPVILSARDETVPVDLHLPASAELVSFQWKLEQHATYQYMYNVTVRGPEPLPSKGCPPGIRDESGTLAEYKYPEEVEGPEENEKAETVADEALIIRVPLITGTDRENAEVVDDVETLVISVHHTAQMNIAFKTHSGSDDLTRASITIPIVIYSPCPTLPEPMQETGDAEPPAYDEAPPPGYSSTQVEGLRQRTKAERL
ncbi:hypothetical protein BC832DRAFT_549733 [Gaertneriomyces semiglobifer]|nr:hypothetical protein BC832DRAFT_549733 [Gaertneriomyces semiglobifer]